VDTGSSGESQHGDGQADDRERQRKGHGYAAARLEAAEARLGRKASRLAATSGAVIEELTDREMSILRALRGPATQREIGAALFLSINTVKAYNKSLYRKLGVASRSEAVATARKLGLI